MKRTGIFGGTFDPIHLGHAGLARNVKRDAALDELIFVPSKMPPHKSHSGVSPADKYAMTVLTAKALGEGFRVSDTELCRQGPSYTWLTLDYFRREHPDDALFFICGDDIFASVESWNRGGELFDLANFIVADRTGENFATLNSLSDTVKERFMRLEDYAGGKAGSVILYSPPPVDISSTEVREVILAGGKPELLLSDVYDYIVMKNLYKAEN